LLNITLLLGDNIGMSKSVQNVKNSLKFKADEKTGVLSIRVGVKKYTLPVPVRMLTSSEFIFLSFPASSELYKVTKKELEAMPRETDAADAFDALNPGRRKGRKKTASAEIPAELQAALKAIPDGMRLVINKDGSPRLVKTRKRTAKK
jgi:hypothetical protein